MTTITVTLSDIGSLLSELGLKSFQFRTSYGEDTVLISNLDLDRAKITINDVLDAILKKFGKHDEIQFVKGNTGYFIRMKRVNVIEGGVSDPFSREEIIKFIEGYGLDGKEQIAKGIKIELEHTPDEFRAEEISLDHLLENPRYYVELEEMEKKLEAGKREMILEGKYPRIEYKDYNIIPEPHFLRKEEIIYRAYSKGGERTWITGKLPRDVAFLIDRIYLPINDHDLRIYLQAAREWTAARQILNKFGIYTDEKRKMLNDVATDMFDKEELDIETNVSSPTSGQEFGFFLIREKPVYFFIATGRSRPSLVLDDMPKEKQTKLKERIVRIMPNIKPIITNLEKLIASVNIKKESTCAEGQDYIGMERIKNFIIKHPKFIYGKDKVYSGDFQTEKAPESINKWLKSPLTCSYLSARFTEPPFEEAKKIIEKEFVKTTIVRTTELSVIFIPATSVAAANRRFPDALAEKVANLIEEYYIYEEYFKSLMIAIDEEKRYVISFDDQKIAKEFEKSNPYPFDEIFKDVSGWRYGSDKDKIGSFWWAQEGKDAPLFIYYHKHHVAESVPQISRISSEMMELLKATVMPTVKEGKEPGIDSLVKNLYDSMSIGKKYEGKFDSLKDDYIVFKDAVWSGSKRTKEFNFMIKKRGIDLYFRFDMRLQDFDDILYSNALNFLYKYGIGKKGNELYVIDPRSSDERSMLSVGKITDDGFSISENRFSQAAILGILEGLFRVYSEFSLPKFLETLDLVLSAIDINPGEVPSMETAKRFWDYFSYEVIEDWISYASVRYSLPLSIRPQQAFGSLHQEYKAALLLGFDAWIRNVCFKLIGKGLPRPYTPDALIGKLDVVLKERDTNIMKVFQLDFQLEKPDPALKYLEKDFQEPYKIFMKDQRNGYRVIFSKGNAPSVEEMKKELALQYSPEKTIFYVIGYEQDELIIIWTRAKPKTETVEEAEPMLSKWVDNIFFGKMIDEEIARIKKEYAGMEDMNMITDHLIEMKSKPIIPFRSTFINFLIKDSVLEDGGKIVADMNFPLYIKIVYSPHPVYIFYLKDDLKMHVGIKGSKNSVSVIKSMKPQTRDAWNIVVDKAYAYIEKHKTRSIFFDPETKEPSTGAIVFAIAPILSLLAGNVGKKVDVTQKGDFDKGIKALADTDQSFSMGSEAQDLKYVGKELDHDRPYTFDKDENSIDITLLYPDAKKYRVAIDFKNRKLIHDCPWFLRRLKDRNQICKHVVFALKNIIINEMPQDKIIDFLTFASDKAKYEFLDAGTIKMEKKIVKKELTAEEIEKEKAERVARDKEDDIKRALTDLLIEIAPKEMTVDEIFNSPSVKGNKHLKNLSKEELSNFLKIIVNEGMLKVKNDKYSASIII